MSKKLEGWTIPDNAPGIDFSILKPKQSGWVCYLFGGNKHTVGIVWYPEEGNVPNWFWRNMQYLCFGNKWEKLK